MLNSICNLSVFKSVAIKRILIAESTFFQPSDDSMTRGAGIFHQYEDSKALGKMTVNTVPSAALDSTAMRPP